MKLTVFACASLLALTVSLQLHAAVDPLAPLGVAKQPAPPAPQPVTETIFGNTVTDNYRFMEAQDPATMDWMKAQGAYTRAVMDAIKPLAALQARVAAFTGSIGIFQNYASFGGVSFYEERAPGSDNFDLVVRDAKGARKIVDVAALRAQHGGKPYAINYVLASPDGTKVAAGLSEGGSEAASLYVYDVKTGAQIAGPVDRTDFGATSWSADSKILYLDRLKKLGPNDPGTEKYRDVTAEAWTLKGEPTPLFGATVGHGPEFSHDETPGLGIVPGGPVALLQSQNGVQNEIKLWTAPVAKATGPKAAWTLLVDRADGVTGLDARGDEIFLLSHKDAPTFKVLQVKAGAPLASAQTVVAADPKRVVEAIHAAADALYVVMREGVYSHLLRIPKGSTAAEEVALPVKGHISETFTDPRRPGVDVAMESWLMPPTELHYDPAAKSFTDLKLAVAPDVKLADFKVSDLEAKAKDGAMVPLSLIQPAAASGPGITLIEAYGSYGISYLADFSPRRNVVVREGINEAVCHVRGGGELGDAWRLAGKDANKHNTWEDIIACGEDLIARGVTTKEKLFIWGGSAGGITMGRAMTARPDLFAGVLDSVPAANTLRFEFSPNGPDNIPEFGSIKTEQGFKNLYEMDSIVHVKPGTTYPAIMISTGLNDPRVSPWEPAKFAAALLAAGTPNPVLLRVDEQAGHGIGSTKSQNDMLIADWIAFMKWRAGEPGWLPGAQH
ncbi:MAG TPA: prolyl oligopeptidase family serine peptidase [Alphaproteobacteria bacterium]|nr:prolyl oligopeptidase family serine peptidase [Alphaproteobacteria bacterium]